MHYKDGLIETSRRIKHARMLSGNQVSQRIFELRHGISANTMQSWEQCKAPLTKRGARRLIDALNSKGILCTEEWLLEGKGNSPEPSYVTKGDCENGLDDAELALQSLMESEKLVHEIEVFKVNNENAIVISLTDNAIEPLYSKGDYLGGITLEASEYNKVINKLCIVTLEDGTILPRILQKGNHPDHYNLVSLNINANCGFLCLFEVPVKSVAKVVWSRRRLMNIFQPKEDAIAILEAEI